MRIFDSHTHLNSEEFIQEVPRYLQQAADLDVTRMAIVGSNTQLNADAIKLAETYPQLVAIVGWHPEDAKNYDQAAEKLLIEQVQHPKVVALGEIGLTTIGIRRHKTFSGKSLPAKSPLLKRCNCQFPCTIVMLSKIPIRS